METFYRSIRRQGVSRRNFLKFCSMTTALLGLDAAATPQVVRALESKPRVPVLWFHGNECTCCTESFIRSAHPLASDVVLSMISLEYDDTIMAAAGHQAEAVAERVMAEHAGAYILAVEGDAPLAADGMYCSVAGKPFVDKLAHAAEGAKAIVAWGQCASFGCVQTARPNPTQGTPVHKLGFDKPVINVPGCPPIAEVMTSILTYLVTFDRLPPLDRKGRPEMFYGQRVHDKCYRRAHFDAGQFAESWDDEGARKGYCLYKLGCRGPTTYNACSSTMWNEQTSFPIASGHGCIGCAAEGFWDDGFFYDPVDGVERWGIQASADRVGAAVGGAVGAGIAGHAAYRAVRAATGADRQRGRYGRLDAEDRADTGADGDR
jgi:hydrogenase small subunit